MADFASLLRKPAGQAKKPEAIPADTYPGLIKSWEVGDNNKNKTPYVRFQLVLTGPGPNTSMEELAEKNIDLSKRKMSRDFYLKDKEGGDGPLWRLDEFIKSCGVDAAGRDYEAVLPELVGMPVEVEVIQQLTQDNEVISRVEGIRGQA